MFSVYCVDIRNEEQKKSEILTNYIVNMRFKIYSEQKKYTIYMYIYCLDPLPLKIKQIDKTNLWLCAGRTVLKDNIQENNLALSAKRNKHTI